MPWWIVILLSKFGQFPTFYPLHFQCHEISLRILFMSSVFFRVPPLRYLHPFCHNHFLIYVDKSTFWSCSICTFGISWIDTMSPFPRWTIFSATPLTFNFTFNFSLPVLLLLISLFHFHLCQSISSFNYSFLIIPQVITGR